MKTLIIALLIIAGAGMSFTTEKPQDYKPGKIEFRSPFTAHVDVTSDVKVPFAKSMLPTCMCGSWIGPIFGASEWPKTKACTRGANYGIIVWEWKTANSTQPNANCDGGGQFLPW